MKIKSILENRKIQSYAIIVAVVALALVVFSVFPFATDGYEDITSRAMLEQRIATALTNHQDTILVDYSGEDWENLKDWLKEDFRYPVLSQYTDEFSIYNYDQAKFTYWTYKTKKRVKIAISYKMNEDEIYAVNNYAEDIINTNGLRNMSQYEAIKFVHDYLINNFNYNMNENSLYIMMQTGETNCYGYTMMNYIILSRLGVDIRTTNGTMNNSHVWNAVKLDNQWYYEDITWDTISKGTDYFLISTAKLQESHTILGGFIPECPSNYVYAGNDASENTNPETKDDTTSSQETVGNENHEGAGNDVIITETPIDGNDTEVNTEDPIISDDDKEDSSFQDNNEVVDSTPTIEPDHNSVTDSTPAPVVPKTEKIQKLNKLLKALKNLKRK